MSRRKEIYAFAAERAARLPENILPDGSVNWDFVSADVHILCNVPPEAGSIVDEEVIPEVAAKLEAK